MSIDPSTPGRGTQSRLARRGWAVDVGDPGTVLAGARRAFFVMIGVLVVIWAIQIANVADAYHLTQSYGIRPRDVGSLPDILTAPFLHFSWTHIEGNSGPLFIFGFLAAYRGIKKFAAVTVDRGADQRSGRLAVRVARLGGRGRQRRGLRLLRLHHRPRPVRPAPDRRARRRGDGAVLRLPVRRAAAAPGHRLAGARGRPGWRHRGRLAAARAACRGTGSQAGPRRVGRGLGSAQRSCLRATAAKRARPAARAR